MQKNIRSIKKYKRYTQEFKKSLVSDFVSGRLSILQLGRLHNIEPKQIYNWIYKFSTFYEKGFRIIEMEKNSTKKLNDLKKKISKTGQLYLGI